MATICMLCIEFFQGGLPPQWLNAPFLDPQADPVYWLLLLSQIPLLLTQVTYVNYVFTILLLLIPIFILIKPSSKSLIFFQLILITIFFLCRNLVNCHHGHSFFPFIVVAFPLLFSHPRNLYLSNLIRYYIAFVFSSAALWKILSGVAFNPTHFTSIFESQHATDLLENHSFYAFLLHTFHQFPILPFLIFSLAILLQISFAIAFLTRNFDKCLAVLLCLFLLGDSIFMGMSFYPMLLYLPYFWYKTPRLANSST